MSNPPKSLFFYRCWFSFFALGTITNLGYVVVLSAAQKVSKQFGADDLLGLIPWANVFFSFVFRFLNLAMEGTSWTIRAIITAALAAIGLAALGLVCSFTETPFFFVALGCITIIGGSSSFGESMMLCYFKEWDSKLVEGWSSGTGLAGVAGSGLAVALFAIGLSPQAVFFILVPTAGLYLLSWFFLLPKPPPKEQTSEDDDEADVGLVSHEHSINSQRESKCARYLRCTKLVGWLSLQLLLVYFFEYVASTGCAAKANPSKGSWAIENSYTLLSFCYQLGVWASRSSLSVIQINRVEVLTILQGINCAVWLIQATWHFINIYIQFVFMFYVGLLGGASYVNVFYLLLNDKKIAGIDRELCINIAAVSITVGITASSLFTVFMDLTWLKDSE